MIRRAVIVAFVGAASITPAYSQIPAESPAQATTNISFDVASVKTDSARSRTESGPPTLAMHPSGQFTALNVSVRQLIMSAYDVRSFQIRGGPDWIATQYFDILAQAPDDFEIGHTKAMMRRLLEERFGLVVQRTTSELPVYALGWVDRNRRPGPWLRRPGAACDRPPADPPEETVGGPGRRRPPQRPGQGEMKPDPECRPFWGTTAVFAGVDKWFWARRVPFASTLDAVGAFVDLPIVDKTGLTGVWDVDIKWDSDPRDASNSADARYGSIFTAVREQLGLKLEPDRSPTPVLVLERVQQPTPD